jgi:hypothetical protein
MAGVTAPAASTSTASATPAAATTPAGVPASAVTGVAPSAATGSARFGRGGSGRGRIPPYFLHGGLVDQLRGTVQNFACPVVIAVPRGGGGPVTAPAIPAPVAPTPVAAPAISCPTQAQCMTGNICLDLRRGCVSSSQVTAAQLLACAQAGYSGNENFFPCVLAALPTNPPQYGTPMPNPPPYSSVQAQDVPASGLSGLGCDGSGSILGVLGLALGIAGGLFLFDLLMKQNWRAA